MEVTTWAIVVQVLENGFDTGQIAVAVALDWLAFAGIEANLARYSGLYAWFGQVQQRHSMQQTAYEGAADDGFIFESLLTRAVQNAYLVGE